MNERTVLSIVFFVALLFFSSESRSAPKFNQGTSSDGVIAFQDSIDKDQFYYIPGRVDATLGAGLKHFKAQYWGIGPAHWGQDSSGQIYSIAGAIISGSANLDITVTQRISIKSEIKSVYGVRNPKLLPMPLRNVTVSPILDAQTLSMGNKDVTLSFPTTYSFGTDFVYSIGTGNSLFAQVVGARDAVNSEIHLNPTFGVSIIGEAEFEGDPWRAVISCDLSQVWDQVRSRASVSVSMGWFKIGSADYQNTLQDLQRSGACTFDMKEGSLDNEKYGRQIFDAAKKMFEEINKQAVDGDGFFKFEPNPQAGEPGGGGASSWAPWSVSVNAGYSHAHFSQKLIWNNTISYTGRFLYKIPTSMILAVSCNTATKAYFVDLGDASQPCITQTKTNIFNGRMQCEAKARQPRLIALGERLALGSITQAQYDKLLALYNRTSFCESVALTPKKAIEGGVGPNSSASNIKTMGRQGINDDDLRRLEMEVLKN
jgi:hypothetical protein